MKQSRFLCGRKSFAVLGYRITRAAHFPEGEWVRMRRDSVIGWAGRFPPAKGSCCLAEASVSSFRLLSLPSVRKDSMKNSSLPCGQRGLNLNNFNQNANWFRASIPVIVFIN